MATNCYACGYRDNEVKSGGAVAPKGKKISLKIEDEEDLSRDLLKVNILAITGRLAKFSPTQPDSRSLRSTSFYNPVPWVVASLPSKDFLTRSTTNSAQRCSVQAIQRMWVSVNKEPTRRRMSVNLRIS